MEDKIIATWKTKGKDWLILYRGKYDYYYKGNQCGGGVGNHASDELAIAAIENSQVKVLKADRPSVKRVY